MAKITVTDDLGNKLHTFSIPDEKYLSAISHIAHHFHFVPGQMEPNPEYQPEFIAEVQNPLYDPAIPVSTEITEGLFAWKQFERWVEDIAKTDIYNESQLKLRESMESFDAGAKVE